MDKRHEGGTVQVEILHRGHSGPALQKSTKKLFAQSPPSWCKYLPNISIKYLTKMWYLSSENMKGMTVKVKILHRGQTDPALQKTSKQLF